MLKAKTPPKKIDMADAICRLVLSLDFKTKNLEQDAKKYNVLIEHFTLAMVNIDKVIAKQVIMKGVELHKEYTEVTHKLLKLNKEVDSTQKSLHKLKQDFITKLQEPYTKGELNTLPADTLLETAEQIKKISEIFNNLQKLFEEIADKLQSLIQRSTDLEQTVHEISLPEQIEEASKLTEKLNERIEMICKEAASLQIDMDAKLETSKFHKPLLQLFSAHAKASELLKGIQPQQASSSSSASLQPS